MSETLFEINVRGGISSNLTVTAHRVFGLTRACASPLCERAHLTWAGKTPEKGKKAIGDPLLTAWGKETEASRPQMAEPLLARFCF